MPRRMERYNSQGRTRNLLHKNSLEEFKQWIVTQGWTIAPTPEAAEYEVLRIEKVLNPGSKVPKIERHIFFQRDSDGKGQDKILDPHNPGSTHITTPQFAENLVKKFIIERHNHDA